MVEPRRIFRAVGAGEPFIFLSVPGSPVRKEACFMFGNTLLTLFPRGLVIVASIAFLLVTLLHMKIG